MDDPEVRKIIDQRLLVMRILVAAMASGVVIFTAITIAVRAGGMANQPETLLISYLGVGFAVVSIILSAWLSSKIISTPNDTASNTLVRNDGTGTDSKMQFIEATLARYQTSLIVGCAIVEGAAFFNLVAYLIEGQPFSRAVALGLLVVLAFKFPSRQSIESWLIQQKELAEQRSGDR